MNKSSKYLKKTVGRKAQTSELTSMNRVEYDINTFRKCHLDPEDQ